MATDTRPTYVAFLRGVNVGAHNRMTMDDLCETFESLGLDDVQTYIQSGNVVFEAAETSTEALETDLEAAIADDFGYDVSVLVRTADELDDIVAGFPFDEPRTDTTKQYVTFLDTEPETEAVDTLLAGQTDAEQFVVDGQTVYSQLDKDALGDGRFTDVGKKLGVDATRRNWNVTTSVHELSTS
ncbi:DUF1697 domain-containing protein [Haloarchaeobius sp. DFWS5]|uniref:DUF1697 domain-containing protein n=1 Tax=Haloarchaeobius sp. DFWS5 TaxID=3446114 RepID=UPI003EC12566